MDWGISFWVGFNLFVLVMLALDLTLFHRTAHEVKLREAALWSGLWVALALLFNAGIWFYAGERAALEFLTGYVIEKSLAVDNIFVFVTIFGYFAVPAKYQHRVLVWGIIGALVMRGTFIGLGAWVLERWHWVLYVFGALLVVTGVKLVLRREAASMEENAALRMIRRWLPVTESYEGTRFFVRRAGRWVATPLLAVLLVIEFSDLVFAIDSIPAIFAITNDPYIVYTSNVFAILGLRSMYFLLAGVVDRFTYLKFALALVLVFIGVKMLVMDLYKIPTALSLAGVALILGTGVVTSLVATRRRTQEDRAFTTRASIAKYSGKPS